MLLNLHELIKKYNMRITGIIHIGAHYGEEIKLYENISTLKSVVLFEPDPDSFQILQQNIKNPTYIAYNFALGSQKSKMVLFREESNAGQSNSLLAPKLHLQQYPHIKFNSFREVDVVLLDNFDFSIDYNMINIDVQGFELEVFKGSVNTLKNIQYIFCEVNRAEMYEKCASVDQIDEFLGNFGFTRVETTWDGVLWGDALYIKDKL